MKNMPSNTQDTLLKLIQSVPPEREFLVNEHEKVTYSELEDISCHFLEKYRPYNGSNIAVKFKTRELAVKFLPAISYLANSLLILPDGLEPSVEQDFFTKTKTNYYFKFDPIDVEITKISEPVSDKVERKWILATSGTTGIPKLVSYGLERLTGTAKKDIEKGLAYNWALVYDVNRFAGLQVYFQSIFSGSKLTVVEPGHSVSEIIDLLVASKVNCLSATPSFFRKLLMDPRSLSIDLTRITLGGEIADQTILTTLSIAYPKAKIIHIYASTEAGVGFSVKDLKEGFPITFLNAISSSGVSLKVKNNTLWIKSQNTSNTMISGKLDFDSDGYVNTGDLVSIVQDRVLFMGRESGTINVGGNKVVPEEIERVILKHDSISECYVYGRKNSMMGMLVACDVVLKASGIDDTTLKKELRSFCHTYLEPFKVPALVRIVNEIEKNSVGKIMRGKAL
ncbi:AMP-binding protein [Aeromonas enteropelogenes]|uniref:AMP-binding protein n=1 Tax=Aeromonas enteropelogenes TaxID=29489 RepID=UPI003F7A454F